MSSVVTALHVLVCVFLVLTVLLQPGKGMGAAFGGGNANSMLGTGGNTFLKKLTASAAAIFVVTSMVLAYFATTKDSLAKISADEQARKAKAEAARKAALDSAAPLPVEEPAPTLGAEELPSGLDVAPGAPTPGAPPAVVPAPAAAPSAAAPAAPTGPTSAAPTTPTAPTTPNP